MSSHADAVARAEAVYNAASDHYDHPALAFWDRAGRETIERAAPARGSAVFDACCGAGASAIPAAEAVGPTGRVLGVDVAERLLARAREKARRRGLVQIEFRNADIMSDVGPDASFDLVVCVFGVFFLPDMGAAMRRLWRLVRPGGRLAITTWGTDVLEPVDSAFWATIGRRRPDLVRRYNPWERVNTPERLLALFDESGVEDATAEARAGVCPLPSPDDGWAVVLGTGYRATIEQLDVATCAQVRDDVLGELARAGDRRLITNVVFGSARKPAGAGAGTTEKGHA